MAPENTVQTCMTQKLVAYFETNIAIGPTKVSSSDLLQFIYEAAKEEASSQSRLLSGLRTFFDALWLRFAGNNPVTLVEPPGDRV